MALPATMHQIALTLSDVDRGVYETLELRVARHPSETVRYLLTRVLAYALSYEPGIAFSKGGLSSPDEAPVSIHDPTGLLLAWIDIGQPSAERLHRASKAARRVALFTTTELAQLQREAAKTTIHRVEHIAVCRLDPHFIDALAPLVGRRLELELVRTEGRLYATVQGAPGERATHLECALEEAPLGASC
jgi:uncharacterized protein YaeQ